MAVEPPDATTQPGGSGRSEDEAAFHRYGDDLADVIDAVLPGWVEHSVVAVLVGQGAEVTGEVRAAAAAAGERARREVVPGLRALLATDVDAQGVGPLSLLREAVRYPTAVLLAAGAAPVERDDFAVHAFPDDLFGLTPAAFADVDERLAEPGMLWGAAKAYVHLARRRR